MRRIFVIGTLFSALCLLPASAILDTNSNGISDLWERAYNGGELFPSTDFPYGPQDDPDGDGWTNEQEAAAGTNPFDPNPPDGIIRPDIVHIPAVWIDTNFDEIPDTIDTPEAITVTWPQIPGKSYTLLFSPDLVDWLPVGEAFIGSETEQVYNFPLSQIEGQDPPPDKQFWRVKVEDVDSDGDGLTDAEEYKLGTDPQNSQTIAGIDDVWLATNFADTLLNGGPAAIDLTEDSDQDGSNILQEYQSGTSPKIADSDGDGIPDGMDAAPKDGSIAWGKTRPTRYALFDVPLDSYSSGYPIFPIGVNSQGMVLFEDGVDYRDSFHPLPSTGITWATAYAINDAGVILGSASFAQGDHEVSALSIWPSLDGQPAMVADGEFVGSPTYDMGYRALNFRSAFGNDSSFVAYTCELVQDENGSHYEYRYPEVWTRASSGTFTHAQTNTTGGFGSSFCKASDIHWAWNPDGHEILTAPSGGGDLGLVAHDKYNLIGGVEPALTGGYSPSLFRVNNAWITSPTLGYVMDISDTGIAHVGEAPATENIPNGMAFWMNGHFLHFQTHAPDLPQTYQDWPNVSIPGMADNGTLVLQKNSGSLASSACAVGIPCALVEDVSDVVRLAYRDGEQDAVPFTGVDDVSITSDKPDPSAGKKLWIMAPLGSEAAPNDVKFHIPVSADNPMTISGINVDGEQELTQDGQSVALKGSGNATIDAGLILKRGTSTALNSPIGIKAMKRRTVKVTVTPVAGLVKKVYPANTTETRENPPDHMPDTERLRKYLNKVFQLQLNAEIELTVKPMVTLDFSQMEAPAVSPTGHPEEVYIHDKYLDANLTANSVEQSLFIPLRDSNADINVYVFGGLGIRLWWFNSLLNRYQIELASGIAGIENREAWVDGSFAQLTDWGYGTGDTLTQHVMHTIAHEMGHIIVKAGHPDQGAGAAPLPGTNHLERLMCAGGGPDRGRKFGTRLVKGEWDASEELLNSLPDRSGQTP